MDRNNHFDIFGGTPISRINACEYPARHIQQGRFEASGILGAAQGNIESDVTMEGIQPFVDGEAASLEAALCLGDISKRDAAVVAFLLTTGLRASDAAALKLSCIDWDKGTISLVQQKNGVALSLPLHPTAGKYIRDYSTKERPDTGSEYIFLREGPPHLPLGPAGLARIVDKVFEKADIKLGSGTYSGAHFLRRRFVMNLLKKDTPVSTFSN